MSMRKRPVERIDRDGNVIERYDSITAAARACYMTETGVCCYCDGRVVRPLNSDGHRLRYAGDQSVEPAGMNVFMYSFYDQRDQRAVSGLRETDHALELRREIYANYGEENVKYLNIQKIGWMGARERNGRMERFDRRTGEVLDADDL